jgi:hypothetical protein
MVNGTRKKGWTYLKCFLLAVAIEVVALASLLPGVLGGIGTRHTANAPPSDSVLLSEKVGFILHLPTVLLTWPFRNSPVPIIFLTPVLQIAFFTFLFALLLRKRVD